MNQKKIHLIQLKFYALITICLTFIVSCDPDLNGTLKIYNQSVLALTVVAFHKVKNESMRYIILPNSNETVKVLSGLGNQKNSIVVLVNLTLFILGQ